MISATIAVAFKGRFSRWQVGEKVLARRLQRSRYYLIERVKWKGSQVALTNKCYGVPKKALKFD